MRQTKTFLVHERTDAKPIMDISIEYRIHGKAFGADTLAKGSEM
ncbi:hypothetical protein CgS9114_05267 [Corynebacterium glutamicum S9114]|nr:hypothetical protein CgS9114_05267 [Corynebacterium glutamicum S9114]